MDAFFLGEGCGVLWFHDNLTESSVVIPEDNYSAEALAERLRICRARFGVLVEEA